MKTVYVLLATLLLSGVAIAGPYTDMVTLSVANASTNAAAIATDIAETPTTLRGYIHAIILDGTFAAGATCTVSVATSGSQGTGAARTIFTSTAVSADATYFPRVASQSTSGGALASTDTCKIPVFGDQLKFSAYAKNSTNALPIKAYIVLSPEP